jgi:hypothetical protein
MTWPNPPFVVILKDWKPEIQVAQVLSQALTSVCVSPVQSGPL